MITKRGIILLGSYVYETYIVTIHWIIKDIRQYPSDGERRRERDRKRGREKDTQRHVKQRKENSEGKNQIKGMCT